MTPTVIILEDGTAVPVAADDFGHVARHDGVTYHLTATVTGTRTLSPAKWCAQRA